MRRLSLVVATVWLVACGGGGDGGADGPPAGSADAAAEDLHHCDTSTSNMQCSEYSSPMPALVDDFESSCTGVLGGTIVDACPAGIVGGCYGTSELETFTVWYYPPSTFEDINCGSSATKVPAP